MSQHIIDYGFEWDGIRVTRCVYDPKWGKVIEITTPKERLHVRVTPSGLIRIDRPPFKNGSLPPRAEGVTMKTWGDVCNAALRRGEDNGHAAYLADQWEKRQAAKEKKLVPVAWHTDQGIVLRADMKELFGWKGAWVDADRAFPDAWVPFLFA